MMMQGFNWESWKENGGWYNFLMGKVDDIATAGITHVWLPPPSHSVGEQGAVLCSLDPLRRRTIAGKIHAQVVELLECFCRLHAWAAVRSGRV
jgi:alpha-amylase